MDWKYEMLINTENNKFIRESWKEWFRIEVERCAYRFRRFRPPKGFIKTYSDLQRDIDYYWFILFVPFVKIVLWLKEIWWAIPQWLYKRGYLEVKEGVAIHWLSWFKYIRFLKKMKIKKEKKYV